MSTTTPHLGAELGAYLLDLQQVQGFSWPNNNCCHFAARWVARITGHDPMQGLAPTPDAWAARHLVRELGGSLRCAWSRQLGTDPINALMAQVGDVVLMASGDPRGVGELVGICAGRTVMVMDEIGAMLHMPLAMASCAWRITRGGAA